MIFDRERWKNYFIFKNFQLKEQCKVFRYYAHPRFFLIDALLFVLAFFCNPYRSCRRFFQKKYKSHLGVYGETPLSTWACMANALRLSSSDRLLELGSGRGRGCFWLSEIIGCRVIGVEWNSYFEKSSRFIGKITGSLVKFVPGNMLEVDFPIADVVYLYGTCLEEKEIRQLLQKMRCLPLQTRVVTISYSLTDYEERLFEIEKILEVQFPWGKTQAYIHRKISNGV